MFHSNTSLGISAKNHRHGCAFNYFFVYCIVCSIMSMMLFLHGFFPLKKHTQEMANLSQLPDQILNTSLNGPLLYKRHIGRLIVMVIDAFRWDFLPGRMPYLDSLINKSQACSLRARCHPPTATMPRIKALMSGSVPNYIDVALNLGNHEVKEDNVVFQAVQNGLKVLFYGDETWLHLFPGRFLRSEGTTSFVVSDFQEVDQNVTRHITSELKSDDWDVMILHYLGLDHIGHMSGPSSLLISPKLLEMDQVIKTLHRNMYEWDLLHPNEPSLIVVVGDHGMHDLGSHGGATLGEILVSLVFIGKGFHHLQSSGQEVSQIDVASTLSVLMGLPIPKSNVGVLIPEALGMLSPEQHLFALHYNAFQLSQQFIRSNPSGVLEDSYFQYITAQKEHVSWLSRGKNDQNLFNITRSLYRNAMEKMKIYLLNALVEFDSFAMGVGCLLLAQMSLLLCFFSEDAFSLMYQRHQYLSLSISLLSTVTVFFGICQSSENCSILCSYKGHMLLIPLIFILCISFNFWALFLFLLTTISKPKNFVSLCGVSVFISVGTLLRVFSLFSSSFVEEEHQTWYFFWVTLLLLLIRQSCWESNDKKSFCTNLLAIVSMLLGHRVLRKLNQTGDKWALLPDIGDWLNLPEHNILLLGVASFSLLWVWFLAVKLNFFSNGTDKILFGTALTSALLYRTSNQVVGWLPIRDSFVIYSFWTLWMVILLRSFQQSDSQPPPIKTLRTCISLWLLISTLLMRPHNLPLLPSILLASAILCMFLKNVTDVTLSHSWLGMVWYFYQGNSNSLATIDVAAGFVGINQQQMILSGALVAVHTLSFPVLSTLLLWSELALQNSNLNSVLSSLRILFIQKLFSLCLYCGVAVLQQHHLFVWSVFAPKLLYEVVFFLCTSLLVLFGWYLSLKLPHVKEYSPHIFSASVIK